MNYENNPNDENWKISRISSRTENTSTIKIPPMMNTYNLLIPHYSIKSNF